MPLCEENEGSRAFRRVLVPKSPGQGRYGWGAPRLQPRMVPLTENNLFIVEAGVPSGPREFCLYKGNPEDGGTPVHPAELLGLERAALIVGKLEALGAPAVPIALSRLLVPCLQYSGSGRHIVVEEWTAEDLRGDSLPEDTRTRLASELAREQAEEWQSVVPSRGPPEGSLAEAIWAAQTNLPLLPPRFEDPELGRLAKALYYFLVPPGEVKVELTTAEVLAKVEALRNSEFAALRLDISPRQLNILFKKLRVYGAVPASGRRTCPRTSGRSWSFSTGPARS